MGFFGWSFVPPRGAGGATLVLGESPCHKSFLQTTGGEFARSAPSTKLQSRIDTLRYPLPIDRREAVRLAALCKVVVELSHGSRTLSIWCRHNRQQPQTSSKALARVPRSFQSHFTAGSGPSCRRFTTRFSPRSEMRGFRLVWALAFGFRVLKRRESLT